MHDLTAFANRLRKVARQRRPWAQRQGFEAYRLYDMDIPELRYIVDIYGQAAVVYDKRGRPRDDEPFDGAAEDRHDDELRAAVAEALRLPLADVHLKKRRRLRTEDGAQQYEKLGQGGELRPIREGRATLLVNLTDYLDTGLFLDHRPMRSRFAQLPPGCRFLNLFCYTGSVSVAAALAGATTTSVDMSNTYLDWAKANFRANSLDVASHRFTRADALQFVSDGPARGEAYDVIFLDPPTFSNSKKMQTTWDVQRDHGELIDGVMRFLAPGGVLYFSTNRQRFTLDERLSERFAVEDITDSTIPDDMRNRRTHRCYTLRRRA